MKLHYALIALAATSLDWAAAENNHKLQQTYIRKRNGAESRHKAGLIAKVSFAPARSPPQCCSQLKWRIVATTQSVDIPRSHLPYIYLCTISIHNRTTVPSNSEVRGQR